MKRMTTLIISLAAFVVSAAVWLHQRQAYGNEFIEDFHQSPLLLAKPMAIVSLAVFIVLLLRELHPAVIRPVQPVSAGATSQPMAARLLRESFARLGTAFGSMAGVARVSVGILLNYLPLGALFTLGYCVESIRSSDRSSRGCLPPWQGWPRLFWRGVGSALALLLYCGPGLALLSFFALKNDTITDLSFAVRLQKTILYCTLPVINISQEGVHLLIPNYGQLVPLCGVVALLIGVVVAPAAMLLLLQDGRVPMPSDPRITGVIRALGLSYWALLALSLVALWPVALLTAVSLAAFPLALAVSSIVLALLWSPAWLQLHPEGAPGRG